MRGTVIDKDFNAPLAGAQITIAETGEKVASSDEGNFSFPQVPPGKYTVAFSKEGYTRQVEANVLVSPGQMTELNAALSGEFTEMEAFVVQDLQIGGTEAGLLMLRVESPALLDAVSAELISRAGVSDAASALKLISGAAIQDEKYAVVRGLPDRYVNSQMNGVRLPSADPDKRSVQLDQFPAEIIESVQVSKTFTPDQQGDASGGAVNVVLKGVPDQNTFKIKIKGSGNSQITGNKDFLSYDGGGVHGWGIDESRRNLRSATDTAVGRAVGVKREPAPTDYSAALSGGGKHDINLFDAKVGGFASLYYKRYSSYFENGQDNSFWVTQPGGTLQPRIEQAATEPKTSLFDISEGKQGVQWGGLATVGIENEDHAVNLTYLYTRDAEDKATLAEDTRGKAFLFPGYDPNDPMGIGHSEFDQEPYLRTETLQYTERITKTLQLHGKHTVPTPEFGVEKLFEMLSPKFDYTLSKSSSELIQPDKRQFGEQWWASYFVAGRPPFTTDQTYDPVHRQFKPAANFTLGNFQEVWKSISEDSKQLNLNAKFPFRQWTDSEGYFKIGMFYDKLDRNYRQDSYSNFDDNSAQLADSPWEQKWSDVFPYEDHPITAGNIDVDYTGRQKITAKYVMGDIPLTSFLNVIGGVRYEETQLSIKNDPESDVNWVPPGSTGSVALHPGDADVNFRQKDTLPSYEVVVKPHKKVTVRGSYSQTIARQTFKELTPIQQQEYLGADVFIGNPNLKMSALKNYDVRLDFTPFDDSLISVSGFYKDIRKPIEYVQKRTNEFGYTTPENYPKGKLTGVEVEVRQKIGKLVEQLEGLTLGANATFIKSEVTLPDDERITFDVTGIEAPTAKRDMTNAPHFLYNIFGTYNWEKAGMDVSVFYTVTGDRLLAGAGTSEGNYIPDVYARPVGTLNLNVTKKLKEHFSMVFQVKNLLNPEIKTVYRSKYLDGDTVKSVYKKGIDYSLSLNMDW